MTGATDKHQQEQLHQPTRHSLNTWRRVGERELDQGIDVPLLGELLLVPGIHAVGIDPSIDTPGSWTAILLKAVLLRATSRATSPP